MLYRLYDLDEGEQATLSYVVLPSYELEKLRKFLKDQEVGIEAEMHYKVCDTAEEAADYILGDKD